MDQKKVEPMTEKSKTSRVLSGEPQQVLGPAVTVFFAALTMFVMLSAVAVFDADARVNPTDTTTQTPG
ncbi:MAG: hypothetical protein AAFQ44_01275 [Pseudomonadota bacterium]